MNFQLSGGCYCGNVTFDAALTRATDSFRPRACDCDFCCKHAAAWVSDPEGNLQIHIRDDSLLNRYRQGTGTADFLVCKECGVLVAVCCEEAGSCHAAINSKAIDGTPLFGEVSVVSPRRLDKQARVQRWQDIWFSDLTISRGR
jgi:hypothetical protein